MSVHHLAMHAPTGSPIRALITPDGLAYPWHATSSSARTLSIKLVECTAGTREEPVVFVDAEGRHWVHPVHRRIVLREERPASALHGFSGPGQVQA